jgi:succinate dehydrogenase / fumarate reductase iron-sulfur subunit
VNERTGFVGAAIINQVRLFNEHPTGKALKAERIKSMMGDGGIHGCSFAQNCVRICPNPHTFSSNHSCSDGREF